MRESMKHTIAMASCRHEEEREEDEKDGGSGGASKFQFTNFGQRAGVEWCPACCEVACYAPVVHLRMYRKAHIRRIPVLLVAYDINHAPNLQIMYMSACMHVQIYLYILIHTYIHNYIIT